MEPIDRQTVYDYVRERIGSVAELTRCLGHKKQSITYEQLGRLADGTMALNSVARIARCIGVPVWYLVMQLFEDGTDDFFNQRDEEAIADLERIKAHSVQAAWAYYLEFVKRGTASPRLREWADANLGAS